MYGRLSVDICPFNTILHAYAFNTFISKHHFIERKKEGNRMISNLKGVSERT